MCTTVYLKSEKGVDRRRRVLASNGAVSTFPWKGNEGGKLSKKSRNNRQALHVLEWLFAVGSQKLMV